MLLKAKELGCACASHSDLIRGVTHGKRTRCLALRLIRRPVRPLTQTADQHRAGSDRQIAGLPPAWHIQAECSISSDLALWLLVIGTWC